MPALLERKGYVAHNYTTDNFLIGAEWRWTAAHRLANPSNMFPVIPYHGLQWTQRHNPDELSTKVLCFDFALLSERRGPSLSLYHYLPADLVAQCPTGMLVCRDHWIGALRGIGLTYGVLYHEAFDREFTELTINVQRNQIAIHFDVTYITHVITEQLASFTTIARSPTTVFPSHVTGLPLMTRDVAPSQWAREMRTCLYNSLCGLSHEHAAQFKTQLDALPRTQTPLGFKPQSQSQPKASTKPTTAPRTTQQPPNASPKAPVRLCIPNLVQTFGVGSESCSDQSCPNLHYRAIRGMPLQRAEKFVTESTLSPSTRQALLTHIRKDTTKFPERTKVSPPALTSTSDKPKSSA